MSDDLKIRVLERKPEQAPEQPPVPDPVSYNIITTAPIEVTRDGAVAFIDEGASLGRLTCFLGLDPTLLQQSVGRDANVDEDGSIRINKDRRFDGRWYEPGELIGTLTDCHESLEFLWITAAIGRYAKLVLMHGLDL